MIICCCDDCIHNSYIYCKSKPNDVFYDDITKEIVYCDNFINKNQLSFSEVLNESQGY